MFYRAKPSGREAHSHLPVLFSSAVSTPDNGYARIEII